MASGKIRGITIELTGDTKGLVKELNKTKKQVSGVQKALEDVEKLLKMDPGNMDLIAQKQKLLADQTQALKEKLAAAEEAMKGFADAGDSEDNIRAQEALTREIAETEAQIREAEKAEADFAREIEGAEKAEKDGEAAGKSWTTSFASGMAAAGEKLKEFGDKVSSIGEELTKKVTGPIVALGGASIAAFQDVDKGYDTIIKKTGATGDELEAMTDSFDNIASEVPASMEDIGSAIGEVNTRFGTTGDELEDLSSTFLKFAQLNDQDVTSAIDSTQKALSAYGLGAGNAADFLDTMNAVAQQTGVSVDKLADGIVQNGAAFQELGLDIDQATVFMGQLEKSGANSETVLGGLRKALKTATAQGVPFNQALEDLQETILNGKDGMDGLTASYELFGKSGDQIYAAVKNGTVDFSDLGNAALEAGGSVAETFEATMDPFDQFTLAMQQMKLVGAEIGATLGEVMVPALQILREKIAAIKDWWDQLDPATQEMIVKIGMIVAAIGPVLIVVGKVISVIGTLMTLAPALGAVIGALTGPVGLVVAAITALIAIGVYLYKNWDEIKQKATEIWSSISGFFSQTWQSITSAASTAWSNLKQGAVTTWQNLQQSASTTWQNIKQAITKPIEDAKQTVHDVIERIKGFFDFNWELPKLKLPHLSITGKFSINPPSVPHFSIDWYAKAMKDGMILNSPTIFGAMGGKLLGGGEAGPEAVVGAGSLQSMIQGAVGSGLDPAAIYEAVRQGASAATVKAYMDGRSVTAEVNRHNTTASNGVLRFMGV